ncbi:MAG: DUF177 domain-containing protein [Pseudomonadota bacterium]
MTETADTKSVTPPSHPLELAELTRDADTAFDFSLSADDCSTAARFMRIREIREARFEGSISPWQESGWSLKGRLTAITVQDCVVTLAPVTQYIEEDVLRRFIPEASMAEATEILVDAEDENDGPEPIGPRIDLAAVMLEGLALALDPYPRADGAKLETSAFTEPGVAPMTDEDARPFAKLAALRSKLKGEN